MLVFQILRDLPVEHELLYTLGSRTEKPSVWSCTGWLDGNPLRVVLKAGSMLLLWPAPHASAVARIYIDLCGCPWSERDIAILVSRGMLCEPGPAPSVPKLPRPG